MPTPSPHLIKKTITFHTLQGTHITATVRHIPSVVSLCELISTAGITGVQRDDMIELSGLRSVHSLEGIFHKMRQEISAASDSELEVKSINGLCFTVEREQFARTKARIDGQDIVIGGHLTAPYQVLLAAMAARNLTQITYDEFAHYMGNMKGGPRLQNKPLGARLDSYRDILDRHLLIQIPPMVFEQTNADRAEDGYTLRLAGDGDIKHHVAPPKPVTATEPAVWLKYPSDENIRYCAAERTITIDDERFTWPGTTTAYAIGIFFDKMFAKGRFTKLHDEPSLVEPRQKVAAQNGNAARVVESIRRLMEAIDGFPLEIADKETIRGTEYTLQRVTATEAAPAVSYPPVRRDGTGYRPR